MSDDNRKLPVPSGENVPTKKTGTDIVPRKGTDVKVPSTEIAHRASTDPTITSLDGTGRAVTIFNAQGGAIGPVIDDSKPEVEESKDEPVTDEPTKGRAKWGFAAVAAAGAVALGLYFANQDDGTQPQQYCVTGVDQLNLHTNHNATAPVVGTIPTGTEVTGTGRMIEGFRQMERTIGGVTQTVYGDYNHLTRPRNGRCPSR